MPHNRQIIATTKSARTPSKWLGNESVTRPGNHSNDKVEEKVGIETGGQDSHRQRLRHAPKTVTGVCQDYGSEVNLCMRRRPSPHEPTNLSSSVRVSLGECGTVPTWQPLACRRRHSAVAAQVGGGTREGGGAARRHGSRPCMCKLAWFSSLLEPA